MQDLKFLDQRSNLCFAVETRSLNPWTTRTVIHWSFGVNSNGSSGVEMGLKRHMFCKMIFPRHRDKQKWPEITFVIQFYCMKRSLVEKLPARKVFFSVYILVKNTQVQALMQYWSLFNVKGCHRIIVNAAYTFQTAGDKSHYGVFILFPRPRSWPLTTLFSPDFTRLHP